MEWLRVATRLRPSAGPGGAGLAALSLLRAAQAISARARRSGHGTRLRLDHAHQWIAVILAVIACAKLHLARYVICAHQRYHRTAHVSLARLSTMRCITLWSCAGGLGRSQSVVVPTAQLQGIPAFGTGIILWLSAAATLALAFQATRQSADSLIG